MGMREMNVTLVLNGAGNKSGTLHTARTFSIQNSQNEQKFESSEKKEKKLA